MMKWQLFCFLIICPNHLKLRSSVIEMKWNKVCFAELLGLVSGASPRYF